MKKIRLAIAALVVTGMVAASANSEAKVRDPISRKTSPERGFFESRPSSSSTYARSSRPSAPAVQSASVYASRTPTTVSQGTVVSTREIGPAQVVQPRATQPRTRFIRVR